MSRITFLLLDSLQPFGVRTFSDQFRAKCYTARHLSTYPQGELNIFASVAGEPDKAVWRVCSERQLDRFARVELMVVARQQVEVVHDPVLSVERQKQPPGTAAVSPLICTTNHLTITAVI